MSFAEVCPSRQQDSKKMFSIKAIYDWMIRLSESPKAVRALGAVSFAESSFFPFPPDIMLLPMSLAKPHKAIYYATICTITSVLGGVMGYMIGYLLYDSLGLYLIKLYGYGDKVDAFRDAFTQYGHWIILLKGLTPIPYKVITITSGFTGYNFMMFVVLSIITRGARFFILAGILNKFGPQIRDFVEKNLKFAFWGFLVILFGGFYAVKFIF